MNDKSLTSTDRTAFAREPKANRFKVTFMIDVLGDDEDANDWAWKVVERLTAKGQVPAPRYPHLVNGRWEIEAQR